MTTRILIVDDEPEFAAFLADLHATERQLDKQEARALREREIRRGRRLDRRGR